LRSSAALTGRRRCGDTTKVTRILAERIKVNAAELGSSILADSSDANARFPGKVPVPFFYCRRAIFEIDATAFVFPGGDVLGDAAKGFVKAMGRPGRRVLGFLHNDGHFYNTNGQRTG
jgi:hypothetical protein